MSHDDGKAKDWGESATEGGVLPLPWERVGERVSAPPGATRVPFTMRPTSHLSAMRVSGAKGNARELRSKMTDAEQRLWYYLRAGRFEGWKFRRQVPLGPYVVDFLCEQARLIVEVDGGQHAERISRDSTRTDWLRARGYAVIRFWNNDVLANIEGVLATLSPALSQGRWRKATHPGPLPREREKSDPHPGPLPREREQNLS
jgi:very-short-patch-repair endonuclease